MVLREEASFCLERCPYFRRPYRGVPLYIPQQQEVCVLWSCCPVCQERVCSGQLCFLLNSPDGGDWAEFPDGSHL